MKRKPCDSVEWKLKTLKNGGLSILSTEKEWKFKKVTHKRRPLERRRKEGHSSCCWGRKGLTKTADWNKERLYCSPLWNLALKNQKKTLIIYKISTTEDQERGDSYGLRGRLLS